MEMPRLSGEKEEILPHIVQVGSPMSGGLLPPHEAAR